MEDSFRLSAVSTTPSSTELHGQDDYRSPHDKSFNDIPHPYIPKTSSGFSLKAAGRTFSFGMGKSSSPSPSKEQQSPIEKEELPTRLRAMTSDSYTNTAAPPKLDDKHLELGLDEEFGNMFEGFGKRQSAITDAQQKRSMSQSPVNICNTPRFTFLVILTVALGSGLFRAGISSQGIFFQPSLKPTFSVTQ